MTTRMTTDELTDYLEALRDSINEQLEMIYASNRTAECLPEELRRSLAPGQVRQRG